MGKKYIRNNNPNFKAVYQDYDWCYDHYINKGMTAQQMADECEVSRRVIEKWCMDIHNLNNHTFKHLKKLNKQQYELCMYGMLGDGHIAVRKEEDGGGGIYIESHAEDQKDYMFWKYDILHDICLNPPKRYEAKVKYFDGKGYLCQPSWRLSSRILDQLVEIKNIPKKEICRNMNEFGLSLYMLDDGSRKGNRWQICFGVLTEEDIRAFVERIKGKFGLYARRYKDKRGYEYADFADESADIIDKIILKNIPNDLDIVKYKILDKRAA